MEEARAQAALLLARAVQISGELLKHQQPELLIRGQANLFDLPEFSDLTALRELLRTLEEKSLLVEMLEEMSLVAGLRVIIGGENKLAPMQRCSIIASTYGRGELTAGAVGVIGPTRMDYARLIPLVHYSSGLISECLSR
jgi:heat-inducible transcriptional repressor